MIKYMTSYDQIGSFSNLPVLNDIYMDYTALTELPIGFAFQCHDLEKVHMSYGLLETTGDCKLVICAAFQCNVEFY